MSSAQETILVLDFGSQYSQLLARRIRECKVYSEVLPFATPVADIAARKPSGIILSGGPQSVHAEGSPAVDPALYDLGIPILGICYGMQLMMHQLGGRVEAGKSGEYGRATLRVVQPNLLFRDIPETLTVWMSHQDEVTRLPEGAHVLAGTAATRHTAVALNDRPLYGIQFHPEVVHTECGAHIIRNFCALVCGCAGTWTTAVFIDESIVNIRERVGTDRVILGLSGGVDSSVAARLIQKAIGDQLTCIFVDNGLLRKNEGDAVRKLFGDNFHMDLVSIDAADQFLNPLAGVDDPETKRKIIGHVFIDVFAEAARKIGDAKFLAQGTTYPDVIESVSINGNPSAVIKSHHNVGGLPPDLKFDLLEPLACLFKDEVRNVGRQLGLPESVVDRHPFPGPGLAVRHLGAVTRPTLAMLQEADAIFTEEIHAAGLDPRLWQAFAVFIPMKTVGVMGDCRTYDYIVALRAVESTDGMTADWAALPDACLRHISARIVNEVRGVNRVVYDITSKPPGTIEWE